jgi:hypothetical protein
MKSVFAFILLATQMSFAASVNLNMEGKFSAKHEVGMMNYATKKACLRDKGAWIDGLCVIQSADTVEIKRINEKQFAVAVQTIGTNAHLCDFEGVATAQNQVQLVTEPQDSTDRRSEPGKCVVQVQFEDQNTVNVTENGSCSDFCGMNMFVDVSEAKRQ